MRTLTKVLIMKSNWSDVQRHQTSLACRKGELDLTSAAVATL